MCAGNELFYTMLYVCHFESGPAGTYNDSISVLLVLLLDVVSQLHIRIVSASCESIFSDCIV